MDNLWFRGTVWCWWWNMNYCLHILSYTAQCKLPKVTGPCRDDLQVMWYYDTDMNRCRQFWYGCQGNANRFKSEKECLTTCQRIVTKGIAYCATCCAIYVCNTIFCILCCAVYTFTHCFSTWNTATPCL